MYLQDGRHGIVNRLYVFVSGWCFQLNVFFFIVDKQTVLRTHSQTGTQTTTAKPHFCTASGYRSLNGGCKGIPMHLYILPLFFLAFWYVRKSIYFVASVGCRWVVRQKTFDFDGIFFYIFNFPWLFMFAEFANSKSWVFSIRLSWLNNLISPSVNESRGVLSSACAR